VAGVGVIVGMLSDKLPPDCVGAAVLGGMSP